MKKHVSAQASFWSHPGLGLLLLVTFINLFNYLDRYILMALSPAIKLELGLSDTQVGFLAIAFMVSYFMISPLFGWWGDRRARFPLLAAGVGLWSVATAACGFARGYGSLIGARLGVGVGEAAYGAISPSILTDLYPKTLRGRAFSIFFMAIPVGSALGYLLGGVLEKAVGWRHAFLFAGLPGILLAGSLFLFREPKRGAQDEPGADVAPKASVRELIRSLAGNSSYVITTLGYCAYTFVVGGVAVWIPHYIVRYLGMPAAEGSMMFGAITVVAGFLGTIIGGSWADRWAARSPDAYLKLSALSMAAALPVFFATMAVSGVVAFGVLVFVLEFFLFLSTSPVNAQIVNSVSPGIRATANAVSIFAIHFLGDMISPPLVGFVSDLTNLHTGMMIFSVGILLSALIWGLKPVLFWEALPWPEGALTLPNHQVHRGLYAPGTQENSLEAFRAAVKAGASMVELDVRLSRDNIAVVMHDLDIQRVASQPGMVREMVASELRDRARAPSLLEVLRDDACRSLAVNIEIKSNTFGTDGIEAAVAKAVKEAGAEARVIFSSFNPFALRRLSKLLPNVPRALLATGEDEPGNAIYLKKMWLATLARPHMLNIDARSLGAKLVGSLQERKVPFAVWTIETAAEARKFLAMGAKSIISPLPKL